MALVSAAPHQGPRAVKTTCPYCGVGCGVVATPKKDGSVDIAGDPTHAANFGKLCVKGAALGETVGREGRLLYPKVLVPSPPERGERVRERGSNDEAPLFDPAPAPHPRPSPEGRGELQRVSWDVALDRVARGFQQIISEHGPEAVAFYVSGQLLTEDYYVANKLMKGYIGSANIDTNSRLCMSSAVAGHKRAFGEDLVPVCYEDLELADLVVLVGSNTAWCHPILFQRIIKAREQRPGMKVVVIDPRRTASCENADLHLPVKSGSDVALFNGLLSFMHQRGFMDGPFIERHTTGASRALAVADNSCGDVRAVAKQCGVNPEQLAEFYRLFACTERVITAFSQGVNQSSSGTDKVNSIINCHLLTGRIGKPGMGPFSITGQPNAMGGREVGGLANMLAAHMELANAEHRGIVQEFWGSPRIADKSGLKAVELFDAIEAGRVKAVWIMATNPVVSLPDANQARRALEKCELVVVSDVMEKTDTTAYAHVLLPAAAWGEKDGTVTNSDRRISRQRAFLPVPGGAKPDWQMICEVARRMGYGEAFAFASAREVFDEHARLSAHRNDGGRCFDIGGLVGMTGEQFDAFEPIQWPVISIVPAPLRGEGQDGGAAVGGARSPPPQSSPIKGEEKKSTQRLFADRRFYHPDRKARFIPTPPRPPVHAASDEYPLILNTGRIRDQWHTMTRTGKSQRLATHLPEPFVDMHPQDALNCGVREGELARVATRWGSLVGRVTLGGGIPRGTIFVPIHWNDQFASDARVGALVNPVVDPISGEPEFKNTPARVEEFRVIWHGFILARDELELRALSWWTRVQGSQFVRYEVGGRERIDDWSARARALFGATQPNVDWLEYEDRSAGIYHAALIVDDRIAACLFVSPRPDLPSRNWLAGLFGKKQLEEADRTGLLLGESTQRGVDVGPTVCSCYGVGRKTLTDAIRKQGLTTTGQITARLKAGGNCGSCVPELNRLIRECAHSEQAA
jgi:assimilatory nitrate reductase catalytic subunit